MRLDSDEELLTQLVIRESAAPVGNPGKGNRRANAAGFVRVPMVWKERLANTKSAAAIKLALELLFESWRTGELTLVLSNALARRAGVTRQTKPRGLRELERLGLIRVKRQGKRAPRVTLAC